MNRYSCAIAAVFALLLLAGCGQSGPLFVPGDPSTVQPQPQQPQTTEAEDEDDDDDENDLVTP